MKDILSSQKTLCIASLDGNGMPQSSYAPYVIEGSKAYIYISQVADHYNNINNNPNVSLMIIKDESNSKNLFGRERVTFNGKAKKIDEVCDSIKAQFEEIHGKEMMNVLYKLDFDFFEIDLLNGRLVKGFGKAYDLSYENNEWTESHVVIDKGAPAHSR